MRTLAAESKAAEERTAGFEEEILETNSQAEASEEMIRGAITQETYLFVQWISDIRPSSISSNPGYVKV